MDFSSFSAAGSWLIEWTRAIKLEEFVDACILKSI